MIALGLDPSTANTGIVVLEGNKSTAPKIILETSFKTKKVDMPRVSDIIGKIIQTIETYHPDMIAIEGYGLNFQHKTSVVPLVTLGAIIRYYFEQESIPYLSPTPSEHKRFITGNGNTKKKLIPEFIASVWGHTPLDGDSADAYGLACMALAFKGQLSNQTLTMREVAMAMKLK